MGGVASKSVDDAPTRRPNRESYDGGTTKIYIKVDAI